MGRTIEVEGAIFDGGAVLAWRMEEVDAVAIANVLGGGGEVGLEEDIGSGGGLDGAGIGGSTGDAGVAVGVEGGAWDEGIVSGIDAGGGGL